MNRALRKRVLRILEQRPAPLPADPIQAAAVKLSDDSYRRTLEILAGSEPPEKMAVSLWENVRDRTVEAMAQADRLYGPQRIECGAGCGWCCHEPLQVNILDAIGVARFKQGETLQYSLPTRESGELKTLFVACPMLGETWSCSVYVDRPVVCRAWHSMSVARCQKNHAEKDARRDVPLHLGLFGFAGLPMEGAQQALQEVGLDTRPVVLGLAVAHLLEDFPGRTRDWLAGGLGFEPVTVLAPRARKLERELTVES